MNSSAVQSTPRPGLSDTAYPLLFVALWSTGFIGAKLGLPFVEPLTFLAVRFAIVTVLMLAVARWFRAPWPRSARQWLHIAVSGLLVHGVYLGGVFTAIGHGLPSGITALVVGLQPLLTALAAGLLLGERVRPAQWCCLALGFAGVALVVAQKIASVPSQALLAMLLPAVVALVGITCGTLYQKRFCPAFDLRSGSVIQFVPTALATLPAILLFEGFHVDWSGDFIFALAWLVLVLSIGAISLLNLLIRSGSAVNVASLFYLTPLSTALIAFLMFDEKLSWLAMLGMGLAVSGVYLVARPVK